MTTRMDSDPNTYNSQLILADGHVHIHSCFDINTFLNFALHNFQTSNPIQDKSIVDYILFLTETKSDSIYDRLFQFASGNPNSDLNLQDWTIQPTKEEMSLSVHSSNGKIFLIAGKQINTLENIEVLALETTQNIEEGQPLEKVIQEIISHGGIPVIPWGFGKWMGHRGKILQRFFAQESLPIICIGDNSGRPTFWPKPTIFHKAQSRAVKILPGTDPLPFAREVNRAGKYGFCIEGRIDPDKPAASIKKILLNPTVEPKAYGSLENPIRFIRNQISMQFLKRFKY